MTTTVDRPTRTRPATLVDAILARALDDPDRPCLIGADETLSWGAFAARVGAVAAAYAGARRLVLLTPGRDIDSVVEYVGALAADQVVLLAPPPERRRPGPDPAAQWIASWDPDVVVDPGSDLDHEGRTWRRGDRHASAHTLHPDLALLLGTSGSTGSPKLVRQGHAGVLANAEAIADTLDVRADDVAATTLPLHYCYGLSVLHSHLLRGATLSLTDDSVLAPAFWERARRDGVTTFPGVPHTFELLARRGFSREDLPTLRYLTQAGGRMPPGRVRALAQQGRREGWDLVVMYGQTEATARMAVLPAERAERAPDAIGLPLPGTSFSLEPLAGPAVTGTPDTPPGVGELVFHGPNVMLGYATDSADLARGQEVTALRTGDLARRRDDGLWQVVGRCSRLAKPHGVRVDLDHLERSLAAGGLVASVADAGDRIVVAVCSGARPVDTDRVRDDVTAASGLPPVAVEILALPDLPRLDNGKVDYPALAALPTEATAEAGTETGMEAGTEAGTGAGAERAATPLDRQVAALYARVLGLREVARDDSFTTLGGDSLSYVEASLGLERILGHLPGDWPTRSVARLAAAEPTSAVARSRRGSVVETNVVLRALAILTIVASHANLVALLGGAHLLLAVVGFNLARFQLSAPDRLERTRRIARGLGRVVLPSVVVIGVVAALSPAITWRQTLLLTSLTEWTWSEPRWSYWFIEALAQSLIVIALLLAVPALDRASRRWPFAFPLLLTIALVPLRKDWFDIPGDHVHRVHGVLWLVVLGWAAAQARTTAQRCLVTAVGLAMTPGLFIGLERHLYLALGLVVLVWVPHLRMPRWVAGLIVPIAGASLWIYLLHWQVYPHLEDRWPLAATVLSVLVGILGWRLWESGAGVVRRLVRHARPTPAA